MATQLNVRFVGSAKYLYPRDKTFEQFELENLESFTEELTLTTFQNSVSPFNSTHCDNIKEIVAITYENGDVVIKCRYKYLFRENYYYTSPCMSSKDYDKFLPDILKYFGQIWWSPYSHEELYYFKCAYSYFRYASKRTPEEFDNDTLVISPCHQLVTATLLCNRDFVAPLPERVVLYILTFLPQTMFRCGDVINNYPIEVPEVPEAPEVFYIAHA